jgi:hypothetical protein
LKKLAQGTLAILAVAGLVAVGVTGPAAADSSSTAQTAKKKKCGKKGKKGAAAAKKCKKKKKGGGATGPSLPSGEWACGNPVHSGMQTKSGNVYTINRADPGTYRYYPDTGIVQFQGGSYSWAFGKYYPDAKAVEIYSNDESVIPVGEYGWTCYLLSP